MRKLKLFGVPVGNPIGHSPQQLRDHFGKIGAEINNVSKRVLDGLQPICGATNEAPEEEEIIGGAVESQIQPSSSEVTEEELPDFEDATEVAPEGESQEDARKRLASSQGRVGPQTYPGKDTTSYVGLGSGAPPRM